MKSLSLDKPYIVVAVGVPGAGKSFFADRFSHTFNAPLISLDALRGNLFNESQYTQDEYSILVRIAEQMLHEVLKTNGTVVIDGIGAAKTERTELAKIARSIDYELLFVWVQTDMATAQHRATKGVRGQNPATLLAPEQHERLVKRFTPLQESEKSVVISGKHTYASQAKIVLKRLTEVRRAATGKIMSQPRQQPRGRNIKVN